jgi:hypothetical protein
VYVNRHSFIMVLFLMGLSCVSSDVVLADSSARRPIIRPLEKFFPKSYVGDFFSEKYAEPVEVKDKIESEEAQAENKELNTESNVHDPEAIEFQTDDISKKTFLPPDQTPSVAINPNAPSSIISMIESNRRGDRVNAKGYAKQFVRVLQNFFFEVREMTSLIGDALIEEKVIEEEDWMGAEQSIDIELARTRLEKGVAIKPTHDVAMKRIIPDPKKEVQVLFIFSRSCSYCRFMAPDVERVARVLSGDSRVTLTGLVVGEADGAWLAEFRDYTGLSIPVYNGTEFAKQLKIRFLPVILVLQPNGERSYFKSGQQSFERIYEFIRTAQGLETEDSPSLQSIIKTPIGQGEKLIMASHKNTSAYQSSHYGAKPVRMPVAVQKRVQVEKF